MEFITNRNAFISESFEPHSDEYLVTDEGYVDVAKQIESMILAGRLLQESRTGLNRGMVFEAESQVLDKGRDQLDDDFVNAPLSSADRRGCDIVDIYREALGLSLKYHKRNVDNPVEKPIENLPSEAKNQPVETTSQDS